MAPSQPPPSPLLESDTVIIRTRKSKEEEDFYAKHLPDFFAVSDRKPKDMEKVACKGRIARLYVRQFKTDERFKGVSTKTLTSVHGIICCYS